MADLGHAAHVGEGKAHVPQGRDPADLRQLILAVIAVIRFRINIRRVQQANLVVVAQHTDTDSGQF